MLAMQNQIELYEEMTALSARMVEAARRNDWDNLIELERSVGALRLRLAEEEDKYQ
jgi:flagellar protein FliT